MEVIPNRSLYTLIVKSTSAEIYIPKHMISRQSNNTLSAIVDPKVACVQSLTYNLPKLSIANTVSSNSSKQPPEETK